MTNQQIIAALMRLRPKAAWSLPNNVGLSGLEWLDQEQTRPSDQEIVDMVAQMAGETPRAIPIDGATFLARITEEEYDEIEKSTNIKVRRWLDIFRLRGEIEVTGNTAKAAKAGLVALKLLTQSRADEIFSA